MIVCKFGGTSVASAEQIMKVASIVKTNPEGKIVAVSAPGKRSSDDIKVTDLLIELAEAALLNGDVERKLQNVVNRFKAITEDLHLGGEILQVIENDLRERIEGDRSNPALFTDSLKAAGEDNNAKLIAAYFNKAGTPAKYVSPKEGLIVNDLPERT